MVAVAAPLCGCQTVAERPPEDERFFAGQWTGSNRFRPQVGARVEEVGDDRTIRGAACWWETSGVVVGQRLDETAMSSETGLSIKYKIGKGSFHIQRVGERKAVMWESRTRHDGTLARPLRTRLQRTSKPAGCSRRYRSEAGPPAAVATCAEQPLEGHWTGRWATERSVRWRSRRLSGRTLSAATRG